MAAKTVGPAATRFMCALVILQAVKEDLLPGAEEHPEIIWDPTAKLMDRIEAGETADGIFAIDNSISKLAERGIVEPDSILPLVQAEFGIAIAPGMDTPPLRDADDLVALLLSVPNLCYSRAGASGIYFESLIDRLGIGDAVRSKAMVIPAGLTAEQAASGRAAIAIQQMSELRAVEGVTIAGPLPPDCQQTTDFSAALFSQADNRDGARKFIELLSSSRARSSYENRGLKLRF
ncbi:molybdate ABC transporter substrate-binding protein [Pelagibacterium sp.]|uniref:molybdate ABC transporter substrate-binding protein n=1 Tax=Pelagibacterium sp. TaxID=1967288 RepID=UPI003BA90A8B